MKQAAPELDGRGILRYSDDPWEKGGIHKILVSPEGELYHWDGWEMSHGQAIITILNQGRNIQDLDEETQEEFLENAGLFTSINYSEQGWIFGFIEGGDLFVMAYLGFVDPQRKAMLRVINEHPEIETIEVEEYGSGHAEVMDHGEAFSYFGGMKDKVAMDVVLDGPRNKPMLINTEPIPGDESQRCIFDSQTGYFWPYMDWVHADVIEALADEGLLTDDNKFSWGYLVDETRLELYGVYTENELPEWLAQVIGEKYPQVQEIEFGGQTWYLDELSQQTVKNEAILKISDIYKEPVCFWCKRGFDKISALHVDYFMEESPDQAVPACGRCFTERQGRSPKEFLEYLSSI